MLPIILVVSTLTLAGTGDCGAVVPGESPVFAAMSDRLLPELRTAHASILARLERWETACDETDLRVAAQELRRVIDRTRDRAARQQLQAVLAVAISRGPDVRVRDSRGGLFILARRKSNAEREARRLFREVLRTRPDALVAREFVTLALATRDEETLAMVDEELGRMPVSSPGDDELRALRALVVLARRDTARAARMATSLEVASVRAQRVRAIVLLTTNTDAAVAAAQYVTALQTAATDDLVLFHEDAFPLLNVADQADFAALPAAARAGWIRKEWEWRASQASRPLHERLQIHFARAQRAIDWYPRLGFEGARMDRVSKDTPGGPGLLASTQQGAPFDDRGLLYIRHGEPAEILRAPGHGTRKEAWFYPHLDTPRGAGLFEFRTTAGAADWLLVAPEPCDPIHKYVEPPKPTQRGVASRYENPGLQVMQNTYVTWETMLAAYDPARAARAQVCFATTVAAFASPEGPARLESLVQWEFLRSKDRALHGRIAAEGALHTEDAAPPLTNLYRGLLTSYAFRSGSGATEILAFLAIPADGITRADTQLDFTARLSLEHPATRRAEQRDTTLSLRLPATAAAGQTVRFALSMTAQSDPAGVLRLTLLNARREGEGQVWLSHRPVPSFPFGGITLSDIVIAEPGVGGVLQRGGEHFTPVAGHVIRSGAAFRVFHEAYGVMGETPARVRITIAEMISPDVFSRLRALVSRGEAMDITFDDVLEPSGGGVAQQSREVTAGLEPGRYQLRVEVTTARGTVERTTELVVVK